MTLRCSDPAAESALRLLAGQAFSRAGGAPLVLGNSARILKDAGEHYPAWLAAIGAAQGLVGMQACVGVDTMGLCNGFGGVQVRCGGWGHA